MPRVAKKKSLLIEKILRQFAFCIIPRLPGSNSVLVSILGLILSWRCAGGAFAVTLMVPILIASHSCCEHVLRLRSSGVRYMSSNNLVFCGEGRQIVRKYLALTGGMIESLRRCMTSDDHVQTNHTSPQTHEDSLQEQLYSHCVGVSPKPSNLFGVCGTMACLKPTPSPVLDPGRQRLQYLL